MKTTEIGGYAGFQRVKTYTEKPARATLSVYAARNIAIKKTTSQDRKWRLVSTVYPWNILLEEMLQYILFIKLF